MILKRGAAGELLVHHKTKQKNWLNNKRLPGSQSKHRACPWYFCMMYCSAIVSFHLAYAGRTVIGLPLCIRCRVFSHFRCRDAMESITFRCCCPLHLCMRLIYIRSPAQNINSKSLRGSHSYLVSLFQNKPLEVQAWSFPWVFNGGKCAHHL